MAYNPKSAKNLVDWKPGQSGNPKGKPKGSISMTAALKDYLEHETDDLDPRTNKKFTYKQKIILELVKKAHKGDLPSIKEVLDRVEGKAVQKQEIEYSHVILGNITRAVFGTATKCIEDPEMLKHFIEELQMQLAVIGPLEGMPNT